MTQVSGQFAYPTADPGGLGPDVVARIAAQALANPAERRRVPCCGQLRRRTLN